MANIDGEEGGKTGGIVTDSDLDRELKQKVNIIQNTVYGQSVKIDDILCDNMPISIKATSKNLIPFPYYNLDTTNSSTTFEQDGLTFKIWNITNSVTELQGQIHIEGTLSNSVTETSYVIFSNNGQYENNLKFNGPITLSCDF